MKRPGKRPPPPKAQPSSRAESEAAPADEPRPAPGICARVRAGDPMVLSVGLFLAVLVVFLRSLRGKFLHFDEVWHIAQNIHVNTGLSWANMLWAFGSLEAANWYPLTWLSHMTDCQLYDAHPWGHHLTSILIHGVNAVLVFRLLRSLTGATWRSFAVAVFFALHPLRVESVSWISERKDVLSLLFWLLTIQAYARYVRQLERPTEGSGRGGATFFLRFGNYWLALFFFVGGLLSKPTVVTLPCVLFLLDFWPFKRVPAAERPTAGRGTESAVNRLNPAVLLLEKLPFFLLAALDAALTSIAQKRAGMLTGYDTATLGLGARMANSLVSYARYLGKLFWPADLCTLYPHPGHWPGGLVMFASILVFGGLFVAWMLRRSRPYLFVGWYWYVGTLVPMIGIVQVGPQSMADRYTYIPSLGILIALAWGVNDLTRSWKRRSAWLAAAGVAAAVAMSTVTFHDIRFWRDGVSVWTRAIAVTGDNYAAHSNLGTVFADMEQLDDAVREWREALRLNPGFVEANHLLGDAMSRQGRDEAAVAYYRKVLELEPDRAVVRNNLGYALIKLGRTNDAIAEFETVLRDHPNVQGAENNLGYTLSLKGRFEESAVHLRKAIENEPNVALTHNTLGYVLFHLQDLPGAERELREVLRLDPDFTGGHNNLGHVLFEEGRLDEAIAEFQESIRLQPDLGAARDNLRAALERKNSKP